jgi:kynurenine 3-monooxygenase
MSGGKRVTIVGGGLAGALVACYLADMGWQVAVYERRPDPRSKGYVGGRSINLALSARGIKGLAGVGKGELAAAVLKDAIPMRGRMMHSRAGSTAFQAYSKNKDDAINSISRGGLNLILLEAAASRPNVSLHFDHRCLDVDLDAPAVVFEHEVGREEGLEGKPRVQIVRVESDLVIGADGAFSAVRGKMQKQDRFQYSQSYLEHGYKELHIPAKSGAAPGGFAMEKNALHIWPRGGSMMIALPNPDGTFTCTLFWPFEGRHSFGALKTKERVERFFNEEYPDAVPLMPTLAEDYLRNPVSSLVTVRCRPWEHGGKVVLVGDAAHAIVPFFGQGMNCAFEDCLSLAERLRAHPSDTARALKEYEEDRKENADAIADMALANFIEMRDKVASRWFRLKKKMDHGLHALFPRAMMPLYEMVSFTTIPYAHAKRRAEERSRKMRLAGWWALAVAGAVVLGVVIGAARGRGGS